MRLESILIVSALAWGGTVGCAADLAVDGYPAEYVAPPVGVETYPRYEFHDGYAYYGNGGWYHHHGDRWVHYRQAPPELERHRR
jgi:hypothetical protein